MACNKIQFQKGLSERQFRAAYGSEAQCRAALVAWRWTQGFVCPRRGGRRCCQIKARKLYQYGACRHQVSLTAGTIFHSTKLQPSVPQSLPSASPVKPTKLERGRYRIGLERGGNRRRRGQDDAAG